jgi:prevent-host-death family protein
MKTIATHEAKTHLSRYLKEVSEEGETIIISRGRTPLAKLVPFSDPKSKGRPKVGQTMDKRMAVLDEALAPLDSSSLEEWGI